ncbi:MAG: helix-turn-helix transcriptional regulator [Bacteriovoracaceae bacterium]|nr:helix-turn-helix transcriptional regulator [Bacteriovoracaceae bacterium]
MTTKLKHYGTKEFERDYGELTFGKLLESHRLSEEVSQKDFAKFLGISASSLCDLEKGRKIPSPRRASLIAKKLKVSTKLWIKVALQDYLSKEGINNIKLTVA